MIKLRYIKLRVKGHTLSDLESHIKNLSSKSLHLIKSDPKKITIRHIITRDLSTTQYLEDGTEIKTKISTMDQHLASFFEAKNGEMYLSITNPPRGNWIVQELLKAVLGEKDYFTEALEIKKEMIDAHVSNFDNAKLVSAKIRDFRIYDNAIGRLEVTSKEGLPVEIAPFISGKYYRIDSFTYEVIHNLQRGLITYSMNGTIKAADSLSDTAIPTFESSLN